MDQTQNALTQSMQQRAMLAQEMDELIQQNELLLKENDVLQAFIERYQYQEENVCDDVVVDGLSTEQKLEVALSE